MGIGPRLVEKRRSSCMVIINNKLARLLFPPSVLHLRRAQWSKRITKSRQWICFEAESVIPNSSSSVNLEKATTGLNFWTSSHTVNLSLLWSYCPCLIWWHIFCSFFMHFPPAFGGTICQVINDGSWMVLHLLCFFSLFFMQSIISSLSGCLLIGWWDRANSLV